MGTSRKANTKRGMYCTFVLGGTFVRMKNSRSCQSHDRRRTTRCPPTPPDGRLSSEQQSLQYRTEGQGGKVAQGHDRYQTGCKQYPERKGMGRKSSGGRRRTSLTAQQSCERQRWDCQGKSACHRRECGGEVVKRGVHTHARKVLAIVGQTGSV